MRTLSCCCSKPGRAQPPPGRKIAASSPQSFATRPRRSFTALMLVDDFAAEPHSRMQLDLTDEETKPARSQVSARVRLPAHRIELSWLAPRPRHPRADATAQAEFSQLLDCN
jgi:hypothetical protein